MVDLTNANVLLVPKEVVDKIGIFYEGYKHGCADNDYSMLVRRTGIPVLITPGACGTCENESRFESRFSEQDYQYEPEGAYSILQPSHSLQS